MDPKTSLNCNQPWKTITQAAHDGDNLLPLIHTTVSIVLTPTLDQTKKNMTHRFLSTHIIHKYVHATNANPIHIYYNNNSTNVQRILLGIRFIMHFSWPTPISSIQHQLLRPLNITSGSHSLHFGTGIHTGSSSFMTRLPIPGNKFLWFKT